MCNKAGISFSAQTVFDSFDYRQVYSPKFKFSACPVIVEYYMFSVIFNLPYIISRDYLSEQQIHFFPRPDRGEMEIFSLFDIL